MKTTIYLHIGESKTGSSIIQNFLDVNREKLAKKHGTLYPNFSSDRPETGRNHNHAQWYFSAIRDDINTFIKDMLKMVRYAEKKGISKIVLSNEGWLLNEKSASIFQNLLEHNDQVEIKIICYLRRIDTWVESAWKQWGLKIHDSIEDYASTPLIQNKYKIILNHLQEWEGLIGKENMIVRAYEKRQLPDGLLHDFLGHIGIDYAKHRWTKTEDSNLAKNFGFNRDVLELLHTCRELFSDRHDTQLYNTFAALLRDKFQKKPFESYNLLSPQQRLALIEDNRQYEQEIARCYMGRPDGKVFHDPLPDTDRDFEPYAGLTLEKALPIIVEMIHQQQMLLKHTNLRMNKLAKQLDAANPGTKSIQSGSGKRKPLGTTLKDFIKKVFRS